MDVAEDFLYIVATSVFGIFLDQIFWEMCLLSNATTCWIKKTRKCFWFQCLHFYKYTYSQMWKYLQCTKFSFSISFKRITQYKCCSLHVLTLRDRNSIRILYWFFLLFTRLFACKIALCFKLCTLPGDLLRYYVFCYTKLLKYVQIQSYLFATF
jgi:hypothetical protein